jgi:hypothetical protein
MENTPESLTQKEEEEDEEEDEEEEKLDLKGTELLIRSVLRGGEEEFRPEERNKGNKSIFNSEVYIRCHYVLKQRCHSNFFS